ncbi:uncharacterized protein ACR2FA_007178 [Aphomia sociella]
MASRRDRVGEVDDPEDLPSDFFDDFTKDEFIDSLSVIDSWECDENRPRTSRITASDLQNVQDLRELIPDEDRGRRDNASFSKYKDKSSRYDHQLSGRSKSPERGDESRLDEFIKPGSRRDPSKTIKAIKKDKEVKVKEYLDKVLDRTDDIRPPGTELDDYYKERKLREKRTGGQESSSHEKSSHKESPQRKPHQVKRHSPHWSPKRPVYHHWQSPRRSPRRSPHSPHKHFSPQHRFSQRRHYSPRQASPHRSKFRRYSPERSVRRSPRRSNRSRSPYRREYTRRSYSRSPVKRDNFLYPAEALSVNFSAPDLQIMAEQNFPVSMPSGDYAGAMGQTYQQAPFYPPGYGNVDYGFGVQQQVLPAALPQPVPAPILNTVQAPPLNPAIPPVLNQTSLPAIVSQPLQPMSSRILTNITEQSMVKPYDALAQLVAEGKLSKEDYLKLAPNKGVASSSSMDCKARVGVLSRCDAALKRLTKLVLPNRLVMNYNIIQGPELKCLAPKFCSPLKRNAAIEFHFTKGNESAVAQHNKQLVDSIIATIGLDKVVAKPKKKSSKNTKDAACQTSKAYCDVCEIRESTKCHEIGTFIDQNHFSASVHSQVVEEDLMNSKSVFNPSGSVADGAPMSISHLTPAQLVSQLAARAKTFKQTSDSMPSSNQFVRRNTPNNYDYDGRGGQHYYNNTNYRY